MSDVAAVLDGGEALAREGALQTSPFPGVGAVSNGQGQKTLVVWGKDAAWPQRVQHPAGMGVGCPG